MKPDQIVLHCPNNYRHIFFDMAKLEEHLPICQSTNIGQTLELFVEEPSKRKKDSRNSRDNCRSRSRSRENEKPTAHHDSPSNSMIVRGPCRETGSSLSKIESQICTATKISKHRSSFTRDKRSVESNSDSEEENKRPNILVFPV